MKTEQRTNNREDEPSNRERRIKAGYRRLLRAGLDGKAKGQRLKAEVQRPKTAARVAAAEYLSGFLCACFALALLVTGCAGPRPLKGGKATTTRNQVGLIQQTVAQGENASQPSKQDQETIKVRSYTLPAATRIEQGAMPVAAPAAVRSADKNVRAPSPSEPCSEPSTLNAQPSTAYVLSAPCRGPPSRPGSP